MASQNPSGPPVPAPPATPPDDDTYNDPAAPPPARSVPTAIAVVAVGFALLAGWGLRNYTLQNAPQPLPMGPIVSGDANGASPRPGDSSTADDSSDDGDSNTGAGTDKARSRSGRTRTAGGIVIQVAGHVGAPGVYELAADSRVSDALAAAGGVGPDGDSSSLDLAAKLKDGERIEVPAGAIIAREAPATAPSPPNANRSVNPSPDAASMTEPSTAPPASSATGGPTAPMPSDAKKTGTTKKLTATELAANPVDIATATAEELSALPGIGPGMAARIVTYRDQHGGFHSIDDLDNVPGIGPKKMDALRPLVTVR